MTLPQFSSEERAYPEPSQASLLLVLGIIGIFVPILGPFAWVLGNKELRAIDSGRRAPENRSTANAARVLGIIGTVLLGLSIVATLIFVALFFSLSQAL
ncbi:MAG TPA: hypothetical protein VG872_11480 [Acidimicrobiia bacterium]|nr:hypothetical protein [Acidimicrobiia bacterium]